MPAKPVYLITCPHCDSTLKLVVTDDSDIEAEVVKVGKTLVDPKKPKPKDPEDPIVPKKPKNLIEMLGGGDDDEE